MLSHAFTGSAPLEDVALKARLAFLLGKHGFIARSMRVIDDSRRVGKGWPCFEGVGKTKTVVLYSTHLTIMDTDEICALFAHEMGHVLHRDTLKKQLLSFAQMLLLAVLAYFTVKSPGLYAAYGFEEISYGFALVWILNVEYGLIWPLMRFLLCDHSRRVEYRADRQAVEEGYADALISGLKKLAGHEYADLSPSPLLVRLKYSCPTLSQRIDAIRKAKKSSGSGNE